MRAKPQTESFVKGLKLSNKGTWIYRIKVKGQIKTGDTGETQRKKAEIELVKIRSGFIQEKQGRGKAPLFTEMLEIWAASRKNISADTYIENTIARIKLNFPNLLPMRIDKIKYEEIEKFLSDYLEKVNKNREIRQFGGYNKLLRILKSMFNLMVERGRIDYFKMPKTQKAQKINYDVLTLDEIDILLPEIEQRYGLERAVMVAMGCFLGLRVSEITNSQYSDINWNTKEFTNKQTKAKESKGIPIPNQMLELFKRIQTATPKLKTGTEYLFLTETGKLYPRNHVDFPLKHLGQALFEKHLTPHSLRRSYITILEIGGVSLGIIQGLARHETPEQTMAYVKIGMKDRVKAVDDIFNKRHA